MPKTNDWSLLTSAVSSIEAGNSTDAVNQINKFLMQDEIDIAQLNDAADTLFNQAKIYVGRRVEEETRKEVGLDHGLDKLNTILGLCEHVGPQLTGDAEATLAAHIRKMLGLVPLFGADTPVHRAMDAMATRGFRPNWGVAVIEVKDARDILLSQVPKERRDWYLRG